MIKPLVSIACLVALAACNSMSPSSPGNKSMSPDTGSGTNPPVYSPGTSDSSSPGSQSGSYPGSGMSSPATDSSGAGPADTNGTTSGAGGSAPR